MTEILINIGPDRSKKIYTAADLRDLVDTINKFKIPDDHPITDFNAVIEIWVDSMAIGTIKCGNHKLAPGEDLPTDVIMYNHQCVVEAYGDHVSYFKTIFNEDSSSHSDS